MEEAIFAVSRVVTKVNRLVRDCFFCFFRLNIVFRNVSDVCFVPIEHEGS